MMNELDLGDKLLLPFTITAVNYESLINGGPKYDLQFSNQGLDIRMGGVESNLLEGLEVIRKFELDSVLEGVGIFPTSCQKTARSTEKFDPLKPDEFKSIYEHPFIYVSSSLNPEDFQSVPEQNEDFPFMPTDDPLDTQVGGDHYKSMKIQPIEFCMENGLDACQSAAIKYICRYKDKNGVEDLEKAKHYIDMLIDLMEKDCA